MAQTLPAYRKLLKCAREISLLSSTSELLGWDEETYLPPGGLDHRDSRDSPDRGRIRTEARSDPGPIAAAFDSEHRAP